MAGIKFDEQYFDNFARRSNGSVQTYNSLIKQDQKNKRTPTADEIALQTLVWDRYKKSQSNTGSGAVFDTIVESIKAQESGQYLKSLQSEMITGDDLKKLGDDFKKEIDGNLSGPEAISKVLGERIKDSGLMILQQQSALLEEINIKAGLTGQLSKDFREEITAANPKLLQMGIGFDELAMAASKLIEQSGRFNVINQKTFERAGEVAKAYVGTLDTLVAMYPEFEKVGLGAADAQERIRDAGKSSLELGLQSQKTTKELSGNLSKLNEYGFQNGIAGLTRMVQKATEFRINVGEVFKIAEKVMSPEGAIDLAANLQVLGGAMGDFNDPMKLMYMATNNVEGLQDALIGAAGGLATFNKEQGRFELVGVNLRKAKEMAATMGVSYEEFSKGIIASSERAVASSDLMARGLNFKDPKDKEFLINMAQMKGGKMTIEVPSKELRNMMGLAEGVTDIALDQMTDQQKELLLKYREEFKQLTDNEVIRNQATAVGNIERDLNFLAAKARLEGGKLVAEAAELAGFNLFKDVVKQSKETSEKGGKAMENIVKVLSETMKSNLTEEEKESLGKTRWSEQKGKISEEQLKNENKMQSQANNTTTTIKQELTFKSDTYSDEIARLASKYPQSFMVGSLPGGEPFIKR
jgi:hypothetical protein